MRFAAITLSALALAFASAALAEPPTSIPEFDQMKAHFHCADTWTKRGVLDSGMFDYCMAKQRDSHAEATLLLDKYPSEAIREVIPFAADKWLKPREYQFDMFAYELEKQGEAMLNIKYALDHDEFTEAEFNSCAMRYLSPDEPQWDMVEYCLEEGH